MTDRRPASSEGQRESSAFDRAVAIVLLVFVLPAAFLLAAFTLFLVLPSVAVDVARVLRSPGSLGSVLVEGSASGAVFLLLTVGGWAGLVALVVRLFQAHPRPWVAYGLLAGGAAVLPVGIYPVARALGDPPGPLLACVPAALAGVLAWRILLEHGSRFRWAVPVLLVLVSGASALGGRWSSSAWSPLDPAVTVATLRPSVDAALACARPDGPEQCSLPESVLRVEYRPPARASFSLDETPAAYRCVSASGGSRRTIVDRIPETARVGSGRGDSRDPKGPGLDILRSSIYEEGRFWPRRVLRLWACGEVMDETVEGLVLLLDYETLVTELRAEARPDAG